MYQIRLSKFNHPEQTEGQHANGPPNVFLRVENEPWLIVDGFRSISKVEATIKKLGFDLFVKQHCELLKDLA